MNCTLPLTFIKLYWRAA